MTALERNLGFLLHDVARLLRKRFEQSARKSGLGLTRSQWQVLAHLAKHEGIQQGVLADLLEIEPISRLVVVVPLEMQGDVMGDLNSRRGRVQGTDTTGDGRQVVTALVPTSEIQRYAIELRSLTGGRGRFHAQHDHYDILPAHLVEAVRREVADEG